MLCMSLSCFCVYLFVAYLFILSQFIICLIRDHDMLRKMLGVERELFIKQPGMYKMLELGAPNRKRRKLGIL
jgi:hypothetical protein